MILSVQYAEGLRLPECFITIALLYFVFRCTWYYCYCEFSYSH